MKPIKLFFITAFLFTGVANAQITKGNWMVGGSGSFTSSKNTSTDGFDGNTSTWKQNTLQLIPNIGYFLTDKLAVGAAVNFNYYGSPDSDLKGTHSYGIGPFIRYYFLKPESRINVFAEASYHYGFTNQSVIGKFETNGYAFKAGPAIFLNSSVALECTLQYNYTKVNANSSDSGNFVVGLGFQIHLEK
jgi:hypothetical protein